MPRFQPLFLVLLLTAALAGNRAEAGCVLNKIVEFPVIVSGLRATAAVKINGSDALLAVDSGAFFNTITAAGAARYKMAMSPAPRGMVVSGVGGVTDNLQVATASDFVLGGAHYKHVNFLVVDNGFGGDEVGLIGENLLNVADIEYDFAEGMVRLFQPKGCEHAMMAYWSDEQTASVVDIAPSSRDAEDTTAEASVNGVKIRVEFDTGSPESALDIHAAARAGVKPSDATTRDDGYASGLAKRSYLRTWIAPFASFQLGGEAVKNTRLQFGDLQLDPGEDMLIGADFFLSHRIYVANSQGKLYFTYGGGPVFNLESPVKPLPAAPAAAGVPGADAPEDAASFARRAAAASSRRDFGGAVADLTQAISLDPAEPRYLYERGLAERSEGQPKPAVADFDQALKLKPGEVAVLVARAEAKVDGGDDAGALADLSAADRAATKDSDARLDIAEAYRQAGEPDAEIAQFDQWLAAHAVDDRRAEALNGRCWARVLLGKQLDKALDDCNGALRLEPADPGFLSGRGFVRLRSGDLDAALADFAASLRLQPSDAWSLYGRGLARSRKGDIKGGQADLQAAIKLDADIADTAKSYGLTP